MPSKGKIPGYNCVDEKKLPQYSDILFLLIIILRSTARMFKKINLNSSLLLLLLGNIYCIWYFQKYPGGFGTVVWIYWFQSIIIGFFNFLQLLTIKKGNTTDFSNDNTQGKPMPRGCSAWFFLFHYGAFHLAYFFVLLFKFDVFSVKKMVLLIGIAVFLMESLFNFIRERSNENNAEINVGVLFFLPYLRIIPMHLMILLPAFIGWEPSLLFLVLKMAADLLSFKLYHFIYRKCGNQRITCLLNLLLPYIFCKNNDLLSFNLTFYLFGVIFHDTDIFYNRSHFSIKA